MFKVSALFHPNADDGGGYAGEPLAPPKPWYYKLHWQILVGMILGAIIGAILFMYPEKFPHHDPGGKATLSFQCVKAIGDIFLNLLKMLVLPLVSASIITGIGSLKGGGVAKLTLRTVVWYMLTTCLAVAAGILIVNLLRPGVGLSPADKDLLLQSAGKVPAGILAQKDTTVGQAIFDVLTGIVPANLGKAVVEFKMLQIVFFSIFLGAMGLAAGEKAKSFFAFFESLNQVMFKAAGAVITLAPVAVAALLAKVIWVSGFSVFGPLGKYFLAVLIALLIHAGITLPLMIAFFARRSPWQYFLAMRQALALAFSTASSGATLPVTMRCQVKNGRISKRISSFVTPLGATVNMDGTALYEAVAAIFICNVYLPDPLSFGQQVTVFLTAVLAAIGAAAIPHAGLVMMVIVLTAVGGPIEGIGLILAVDRLLDMCRTMVNVWGDCVCAAVVNRSAQGGAFGATLTNEE